MKTLADLKRHLKAGMVVELEHMQSGWKPGPRKILSINTVGFTLETIKADGSMTQSHCEWPKAAYFEPIENGFLFFSDWYADNRTQKRLPLLKYTFVK